MDDGTGEMELREQIARAICDVWGYVWDGEPGDDQTPPDKYEPYDERPSKVLFGEAADAVLPALRAARRQALEEVIIALHREQDNYAGTTGIEGRAVWRALGSATGRIRALIETETQREQKGPRHAEAQKGQV